MLQMAAQKKVKRGAVTKRDAVFIGVWLPTHLTSALDRLVASRDMDRSKLIREFVRGRLESIATSKQPQPSNP